MQRQQQKPGGTNQWTAALVAGFPWTAAAFTSLYLKYRIMEGTYSYDSGGFTITEAILGRREDLLTKLSFFRMDLLLGFVIVPLALVSIAKFLPVRWRMSVCAAFSAAVSLALVIQLRAFDVMGQFLSLQMLWTALTWGLREPLAYANYLHLQTLAKGVFVLLVCIWGIRRLLPALTKLAIRADRYRSQFRICALAFCALIVLLPWISQVQATPYHRSAMVMAIRAYEPEMHANTKEFEALSPSELLDRYRQLSQSPAPAKNSFYFGKEKGSSVLVFVLETTAYRFLPTNESMDDLPNLKRLRERSFVPARHYTTFPRTHEAVFSLLSSWYPSDVPRTYEQQQPGMQVPGLMRSLAAQGYDTSIYSPMKRWASLDEEMFQSLGVKRQVYPQDSMAPAAKDAEHYAAWQKKRIARDNATLNLLIKDLDTRLCEKQNFAAVFLPQVGHLPYPDGRDYIDSADLKSRARNILRLEDAWLGQILDLLQLHGQLDNTVIVIVGDHGIRTREEDPTLNEGVDDYSFHVPLLIYAPRAVDHTVTIPWLTSHIDVAPTVLDLLGVEKGRQFEEGTAVWNPQIQKRQTFFLASILFGADGFASGQNFYMANAMSKSVYQNSVPTFDSRNLLPEDSPATHAVPLQISRLIGLQEVLITHFGEADSFRSHIFDR